METNNSNSNNKDRDNNDKSKNTTSSSRKRKATTTTLVKDEALVVKEEKDDNDVAKNEQEGKSEPQPQMIPVGYAIPGEAAAFDAIKLIVDTVDELMDMDPTTNFKLVDEISINDDDGQNNSSTKMVPLCISFDVIGLS